MTVLYWFEGLRVPFLDVFFSAVTHLGEEILFMVIAMAVMWCVDKKQGYYLLIIGLVGTQINQLLKVTFRIERPWVKDPAFSIVESARAEATGYSFPSGHTQCAVGTYGALARWNRHAWLRVLCIAACVLVPLSRMYLGVHTPLDVGVSTAIAVILVVGLYPVLRKATDSPHRMRWLLGVLLGVSVLMAAYMTVTLWSAPEEELQNGLKTAYKMLGSIAGFCVAYELDVRYIRFETNAVWWAQLLKIVLGLAFTLGIKELCYAVFGLIPNEPVNRALSYFVLVIFAGAVWPMTFRFFQKLGQKRA